MSRISSVVIHCADPARLAPFWSLVTGIPVVEEDRLAIAEGRLAPDESVLLRSEDGPSMWITPARELAGPGRIHLDLVATPDQVAEYVAAGATVVAERDRWTVLADPEGNEFCVFDGRH